MEVKSEFVAEMTIETLLISSSFNYLNYKREVLASSINLAAKNYKTSVLTDASDVPCFDIGLLTKNLLVEVNSKKLFSKSSVVALLQKHFLKDFKETVSSFLKKIEISVRYLIILSVNKYKSFADFANTVYHSAS